MGNNRRYLSDNRTNDQLYIDDESSNDHDNIKKTLRRRTPLQLRSPLRTAAFAAGALALLVVAASSWRTLRLQGELVRADPDALAADPVLMRFGADRGAPVFAAHCASCHGAAGRGDPTWGVPDLTDQDWLYGEGRVSDIEQVVRFGIRARQPRSWNLATMPAFGRAVPSTTERVPPLTPSQIADVTAYLLSLGGRAADPDSAHRGRGIFADTGGCYDCHASDGKGDRAIGAPDLTDRVWLYGDGGAQAIARSITYGRQGVCPAWSGRLTPVQTRAVSLYVFSLSHRGAQPPAEVK